MGWLSKRRNTLGMGISFIKRFFFLISSRPIHPNIVDGKILSDSYLPEGIEFDTIYSYDYGYRGDNSKSKPPIKIE